MTKKSEARVNRDLQAGKETKEVKRMLQDNTAWTDLEEMFQRVAHAIVGLWQRILDTYNNPAVVLYTPPAQLAEVQALFAGMNSDVDSLTNELALIHQGHAHKRGASKTHEEFADTVSIYEQYVSLEARMQVLIVNNGQVIMEHAGAAIAKAAAAEQAQNSEVVTDVQAKLDEKA